MNEGIKFEIVNNVDGCFTVRSVSRKGHLKEVRLHDTQRVLTVPLSACVTDGNKIRIENDKAWVQCLNGEAQFLQPYIKKDTINLGGIQLDVLVKEITDLSEYQSYQKLSEFHYRDNVVHGRTSCLVVYTNHTMYPNVIGYIELATPLYMNKARAAILDAPFKFRSVKWNSWDKESTRQYTNIIVRISRVVVYPEFRGLGLGQILVKHATEFSKTRWQVAGLMPYFLEISADMLKYVPFAEKAGMHFIGETQGNLSRVYRDMRYLTQNVNRIRNGEIVSQESCGIVDQQVARMERLLKLCEQEGLNKEELLERLRRLSTETVLRDFALFHSIVSLPKPTYLKGLFARTDSFIIRRINEISIRKVNENFDLRIQQLSDSIKLESVSISFASKVRRTFRTHAVQQAFGISPESINTRVISDLSVEIVPGEVIFVTGPSGSGKTTFLNFLCSNKHLDVGEKLSGHIEFPYNYKAGNFKEIRSQKALIELLSTKDIDSALNIMGIVGLSDAFIYLKRFEELSKGQQYRAMLAQLIISGFNVWIIDEFCTNLDPITANIVTSKLQQLARKLGVTLIIAAPHCDTFIHSLSPDKVIIFTSACGHSIISGNDFIKLIPKRQQWGGKFKV